jgi:hypothetical protein
MESAQVSERSASVATSTTSEVRMSMSGITGRGSWRFIAGAGESVGGGGENLEHAEVGKSYRIDQLSLTRSLLS